MADAVVSLLQELYPECEAEKLKDLLHAFAGITLKEESRRVAVPRSHSTAKQCRDERRTNAATYPQSVQQQQQGDLPLRENLKFFSSTKCATSQRDELVARLYRLFNDNVFDAKLPDSMEVKWNPRLTKTAGFCKCKRSSSRGLYCVIVLSPKICDTPGRIRDTLLHEMCHAATWLIDKVTEGHGPHWRRWCQRANEVFPEIPAIKIRHSYEATTKFVYVCSGCSNRIHRHSKSIDVSKKICALCKGRFQLLKRNKATGVYERA